MEDERIFEESANYYIQSINNNDDIQVVATPELKLLHQEFTAKLCNREVGRALNDEDVVALNMSSNPLSVSTVDSKAGCIINDLQYYCYKPSNSFELTQRTIITGCFEEALFVFDGFLLISRKSLKTLPLLLCRNFNKMTSVSLKPHPLPKNFVVNDLILFNYYLFEVLMELQDYFEDNSEIYYYPVFKSPTGVIASMATVLNHLITSFTPLNLKSPESNTEEFTFSSNYTNHLVYNPHQRPSTLRVDQLTWTDDAKWSIVHYCHVIKQDEGAESPSLIYSNMKKTYETLRQQNTRGELNRRDYFKMIQLRNDLRMKKNRNTKEEVITLSCDGHMTTGIYSDVSQHALLLPAIARQIKYHHLLNTFEEKLSYKYNDKLLLQTALTHHSYLTIQDGCQTQLLVSQDHCGSILPDKPSISSSKRFKSGLEGLTAAINSLGNNNNHDNDQDEYNTHNERLEFLGDAVIELITSYHLYHMFPQYTDGQLVIYRKALICNEYLAKIAEKHLDIDKYILMNKSSDEKDIINARANALEAVIGSIYLDAGLEPTVQVLSKLFFPEEDLYDIWMKIKPHPLKQQHPQGDRHVIPSSTILQKFTELEDKVGIIFTNICLLGKAFVHPSFGYTDLFKGNYQRMEFLGDAILQFVTSLYVFKTFPNSHEGHLTVFRMAVVHNKQLAKVSEELGFTKYILLGKDQADRLTEKIKADVIESFLAALYLDKGFAYAEKFCEVCLFPKLFEDAKGLQFIDAKSRLQHSLVHTCKRKGLQVEPPVYRVLNASGSGDNRKCTVGVYFKKERLAVGTGLNAQSAGMAAAENALSSDKVIIPRSLRK